LVLACECEVPLARVTLEEGRVVQRFGSDHEPADHYAFEQHIPLKLVRLRYSNVRHVRLLRP
jgi:hypothetical protein